LLWGSEVTLENNTFVWNGEHSLGGRVMEHQPSTDAIVRNNTFSYNGRNGWGDRVHRMLLKTIRSVTTTSSIFSL